MLTLVNYIYSNVKLHDLIQPMPTLIGDKIMSKWVAVHKIKIYEYTRCLKSYLIFIQVELTAQKLLCTRAF